MNNQNINISYTYEKQKFIDELRNFEMDLNLYEWIYNLHFHPYNIDKWLSRDIYEYINFDLFFNTNFKNNNNLENLSDDLLSLYKIRNFLFSGLKNDVKITIFSKNYGIPYIFKYENYRIKIINDNHFSNKIVLNDKEYSLEENVSKHNLLHFILNPFWKLDKKKYKSNKTKLDNNNNIIIYTNENNKIEIKNNNIISCILDNYNINFENEFIKKIINEFFNLATINFDKFDKTIMLILENDSIEKEIKNVLWSNYTYLYNYFLFNKKNKKDINWNILNKTITESELNIDNKISIYNLDELLLNKIKVLNINGNDLFIIIPYIYKNNHILDILPYFLKKEKELPFCSIREKIISSFFNSNKYKGNSYISNYGFKYIQNYIYTKINKLSFNSNFVYHKDIYYVSKEIENISKDLDLFLILSDEKFKKININNKSIYNILDSKYCIKLKAYFIILIFKNNINYSDLSLLEFLNDNIDIMMEMYKKKIYINKIKYTNNNEIKINIPQDYKVINTYDIITQYLTNYTQSTITNISLSKNYYFEENVYNFIHENISDAKYNIDKNKIYINNIIWNKKNIFDIILKNSSIIYLQNVSFFKITYDYYSYIYKNKKIYFRQFESKNNEIYIEFKNKDINFLYWLLSIKII